MNNGAFMTPNAIRVANRIADHWPRIMIDVDDERPARDDEVGQCDFCHEVFLLEDLAPLDDGPCSPEVCAECRKEAADDGDHRVE